MEHSGQEARALGIRMFLAMLATQELLTAYLGVRLGLYQALVAGPASADELADRAGVAPRYAREWLEQQAVAGLLRVVDGSTVPGGRRFELPPGHAEVLLASDSPLSMVSLTTLPLGGVAAALPSLLAAFRSGAGVPDAVFGEDWRDGHSGANRALFTHFLPGWLAGALPGLHQRLTGGAARIADIGCGAGWAGIALAKAYPLSIVDGYDLDPDVVDAATANAVAAGVGDRVTFAVQDAATVRKPDGYDLVCLFDTLHEMSQPVPVLRAARSLRADGGTVLVLDAKVQPTFTAPGDEIERFQYATSVLHCLPAGLAGPDSQASGTAMRPSTVTRYARAAGFTEARVLSVDDRFHRLYELVG